MHPITQAFLSSAAETLGVQLVQEVDRYLNSRLVKSPSASSQRATAAEIAAFLKGGAFAGFVADRVIVDACTRFGTLTNAEQQAVFLAALAKKPDAPAIVYEIVAYMANRP